MTGMDGARALLAALNEWDVRHVFCCPGTTEIPLLDALADPAVHAPEFVLTTHEAISVSMADGYARATGGPAVAYLHTNVGLANGLAHLYAAQLARSPVAVLAGVKSTATLPHRALTTTPGIRETARPYVRSDWQSLRPDGLAADVHRTLWRALVPPEQPSLLVVPQDVLAAETGEPEGPPATRTARQAADPASIEEAAAALDAARRPLIVAGSDVARRDAVGDLAELARLLGAPVFAESRRDLERTAYPTTGPHYAGLFDAAGETERDADVILLAGGPTPLEFEPGRPLVPPGAKLVHLSEDAAEPGLRLPTAHTLAGDTALGIRALVAALAGRPGPDGSFLAAARERHEASQRRWAAEVDATTSGDELSAASAMRVLAGAVPDDAIVVADAVTSTLPLLRFLRRERADGFHTTASGSLGWGMGAALGVALAEPERRTLAVVGDGVFQFGVPSLWTAVRYRLPVTFVVVNNGAYQAVVSGLRRYGGLAHAAGDYPLTDIGGPDIAQVAAGFGLPVRQVAGPADLDKALREADDPRAGAPAGPSLIEVKVNRALWQ